MKLSFFFDDEDNVLKRLRFDSEQPVHDREMIAQLRKKTTKSIPIEAEKEKAMREH